MTLTASTLAPAMAADILEPRSWRAEVLVKGQWNGNSLRFPSEAEASDYGFDMFMKWANPTCSRATPSADLPNYRYVNRRLISIEDFEANEAQAALIRAANEIDDAVTQVLKKMADDEASDIASAIASTGVDDRDGAIAARVAECIAAADDDKG